GQERPQAVAAVRWRAVAHRARVPLRRVPQSPFALLRDGRGRGRARRREPAPVPRPHRRVPRRGAAPHREPPEAHDGGRRLPLWRHHAARRQLEGRVREGHERELTAPPSSFLLPSSLLSPPLLTSSSRFWPAFPPLEGRKRRPERKREKREIRERSERSERSVDAPEPRRSGQLGRAPCRERAFAGGAGVTTTEDRG